MNRQNTKQHNKKFTKNFNNKTAPKQDEHFLDFFKPGVEVRGGDVNKALRVLKKRLERSDFQKELAKQAFYEKPSIKRKRKKQQAKKRWERHVRDAEASGDMRQYEVTGTKWMKSKRKSRKVREAKERHLQRQRSTGYY
jgi:small subunit ribosomal protein S21